MFLAMAVLAELVAVIAAGSARLGIYGIAQGAWWMSVMVLTVAGATFLLGARRKTSVDARIFYWALTTGAIVGVVI